MVHTCMELCVCIGLRTHYTEHTSSPYRKNVRVWRHVSYVRLIIQQGVGILLATNIFRGFTNGSIGITNYVKSLQNYIKQKMVNCKIIAPFVMTPPPFFQKEAVRNFINFEGQTLPALPAMLTLFQQLKMAIVIYVKDLHVINKLYIKSKSIEVYEGFRTSV